MDKNRFVDNSGQESKKNLLKYVLEFFFGIFGNGLQMPPFQNFANSSVVLCPFFGIILSTKILHDGVSFLAKNCSASNYKSTHCIA